MDKAFYKFRIQIASRCKRLNLVPPFWSFFVWANASNIHSECTLLNRHIHRSSKEDWPQCYGSPSILCTRYQEMLLGQLLHNRFQLLPPQTLLKVKTSNFHYANYNHEIHLSVVTLESNVYYSICNLWRWTLFYLAWWYPHDWVYSPGCSRLI